MDRRDFIKTLGLTALGGLGVPLSAETMRGVTLREVDPILLRGTRGCSLWNLVRLRTNVGLEGVGEGFSWCGRARARRIHGLIRRFGEKLVGKPPPAIIEFLEHARSEEKSLDQEWNAAVSAIEIALWDLLGKVVKLPVYTLLGGPLRTRIPLYADHAAFYDGGAGEDTASRIRRILELKDAGFTMFKWNPMNPPGGARELTEQQTTERLAILRDVREAVGPDFRLAIDAGGTFTLEGAKKAAAAMAPFDIFWFEEPLHFSRPEGFRALAQETQIPLGTGEHFTNRYQVQTYLDTGAIRYFQTEVGTNGGILETIKVAAMAETHGVQIATHDWVGPVLRMAGSHVCAVIPNLIYQEYAALAPTDAAALELLDPPTRVEKGHIVLSDAPGLGFELNEKLVAARRVD